MRYIIFWIIALLALFHYAPAHAADYSVKFGPGLRDGSTTGATKSFGVRREEDLMHGLHYALEGGGYVDNGGPQYKSAAVVRAQLGATPGMHEGIYGKAFVGPCVISATDSLLGGRFPQFCTDVGVGFRDVDSFMTIGYSHISSAGLVAPNRGRDFVVFEVGVRI